MTAEIINLIPYIAARAFLTVHYDSAVKLSQGYQRRGQKALAHEWFVISQDLAAKIDRVGKK